MTADLVRSAYEHTKRSDTVGSEPDWYADVIEDPARCYRDITASRRG